MNVFFLVIVLFSLASANAAPQLNATLPDCALSDGELKAGGPWQPQFGAIPTVIFYVDPDERATNDHVAAAIKATRIPPERIRSYAIINYAASWLPNIFIQNALLQKQKEYAHTTYVKDLHKRMVSCWGLADDASDVLLIGKDRALKFYASGALSNAQVTELIEIIRSETKLGP